ncbi:MAG TPA: PKD domain-containing protein [Terriglobales bacterium]
MFRSITCHYPQCALSFVLVALMSACGGSTPAPSGPVSSPSTTLAAETGNNTSAADSFTAQANGNAGAGNVSKQPIASLLYSGATTKIYATWLGWFGQPNHMQIGYQSNTQAEVHAQVQDMISRGMAGAIADWYGAANTTIDSATMLLRTEAEASGGKFQFAIMEDKGALGPAAVSNGCDVTNQLISDLSYIASQYESSSAYIKVNGRPVVYFFDVDTYYIDWPRVLSSVPNNPIILIRGTNGFTRSTADGGYSWVSIQQSTPFNPELSFQDSFFTAAQQTPNKTTVGTAFKGFNDTLATWGTNRVIDQNCGQTWLQSFKEVGKFYSSGNQLPALQIATWNDYEEGTTIEPGIDNCVYLVPSQSGSTINWTVNGNENTIDHYTVFISTDSKNLSSLIDIPNGTHSVDLSKLNLSADTTYFVYIKAIGLPSIQNKISPAIAYHAGDQPPTATLQVSQNSGLSYTASTAGSSGSVAKSVIDFGDGTVATGNSATHTYGAVGKYLITATVSDSSGASSVAIQQISAKLVAGGISVASPGNNATVNWPTPIVASANGSSVSAMQVLVDGKVAYASHGDTLNTEIKVFTGTHQVTVQSLDASGNPTGSASMNVTGEPNDAPPVAKIQLTAMPNISPTAVLACAAVSTDPDGFVNSHKVVFSNGAMFSSAGLLETFAAPGTYTATVTATDEFGATDTSTTTFSVGGGAVSSLSMQAGH